MLQKENEVFKITITLGVFLSFILAIFDIYLSLSFVLGILCYFVYKFLLVKNIDFIFKFKFKNKILLSFLGILNIVVLSIPLVFCVFFKNLNPIFCMLGVVFFKIILYFSVIILKK